MAATNRLTPSGKRKLARLIRSTRRRLGLTQTEFGKLIGAGQRAVSNWELGKGLVAVVPGMLLQRLVDDQTTTDTTAHRLREANKQLNAQIRSSNRTPKSEQTGQHLNETTVSPGPAPVKVTVSARERVSTRESREAGLRERRVNA